MSRVSPASRPLTGGYKLLDAPHMNIKVTEYWAFSGIYLSMQIRASQNLSSNKKNLPRLHLFSPNFASGEFDVMI